MKVFKRLISSYATKIPRHEISPWIHTPTDLQSPLDGRHFADVVVVGAGYAGLTASLTLRRAGANVILLERCFAGFGASGRCAGHLTPTIGKDLPTLLMMNGEAKASRLVRFADESVSIVEDNIKRHAIDCDYRPTGNVMAAVHSFQESRLRRSAETAIRLGARVVLLDRDEMRRRRLPEAFVAGLLEMRGGTLHPGKYVAGLRRVVVDTGVKLFEDSPVIAIDEESDQQLVHIRTPRGVVSAPHVILTTNAYAVELNRGFKSATVPLYVTLFETVPLTPSQREALGWTGSEGIYTAHENLESYRLTVRGTIIAGSKAPYYPYSSDIEGRHRQTMAFSEYSFQENLRYFRLRFPSLKEIPIAHTWGGWIDMTLNMLPMIGITGKHQNIHHLLGFNGHGIAGASALGPVVANTVLSRMGVSSNNNDSNNEIVELFKPFMIPLPPEPLRWVLIRGLLGLINTVDIYVDSKIKN